MHVEVEADKRKYLDSSLRRTYVSLPDGPQGSQIDVRKDGNFWLSENELYVWLVYLLTGPLL